MSFCRFHGSVPEPCTLCEAASRQPGTVTPLNLSQPYWAKKLYEEAMRDLVVFGTSAPFIYKPIPWYRRAWWRVLHYRNRVRDAWLVLIGRKDASDPCEF